jgi:hypothetical protein
MASPARPVAAEHPHLCIEAEFAFRFAKSLPPRTTPYARDEVLAAVGAVVPAAGFGGVLAGFAGVAMALGLAGVAGGMGAGRFGWGATCSTGRAPAATMPPDRSPGDPPRLMVIRSGFAWSRAIQAVGSATTIRTAAAWIASDADMIRPRPSGSARRR